MNSPNGALLARARRERLDLGYVTVETRAELWLFGISSIDLEGYLASSTGV